MRKLKIGIIDLVSKGPTNTLWARIMHANLASIMPQVVATWCEQAGHEVTFICYTGLENLEKELPRNVNIVFICSFTQAAFLAYGVSMYCTLTCTVTVVGGRNVSFDSDVARTDCDYVLRFIIR